MPDDDLSTPPGGTGTVHGRRRGEFVRRLGAGLTNGWLRLAVGLAVTLLLAACKGPGGSGAGGY